MMRSQILENSPFSYDYISLKKHDCCVTDVTSSNILALELGEFTGIKGSVAIFQKINVNYLKCQ